MALTLQGIREEGMFPRARAILRTFPIFRVRGLKTFEHAARIYRDCRKRELTIRSTIDCLIAATCVETLLLIDPSDRQRINVPVILKNGKI